MNSDAKSLVVSLFLGGAVGAVLTFFTWGLAMNAASFSDFSTILTSEFGSGWNLGSLAVSALSEGLFDTFVGISAVYFTTYRLGDNALPRPTGITGEVSQKSS
ncbi:MAG: hypothetical protein OK404_03520 [Thaumarchaeota archaeon]|nr:hypothetical protein [Nitrososphaerota archaeon]